MKEMSVDIYADFSKNRLYLQLTGKFSTQQAVEAADLAIHEARKLKPGFQVITDISQFMPMNIKDAQEIKRVQLFLKENGVGRVVRVVDMKSNLVSKLQFDRTGKGAGYEREADTAASLEEAERMLDAESSNSPG